MSLTVICSPVESSQGYGVDSAVKIPGVAVVEVKTWWPPFKRFGMYQKRLIQALRGIRPDSVIIFANLRYLSFWIVLVWCKIHGIPVFPHGHGLYKKLNPGRFWKATYWDRAKEFINEICS